MDMDMDINSLNIHIHSIHSELYWAPGLIIKLCLFSVLNKPEIYLEDLINLLADKPSP